MAGEGEGRIGQRRSQGAFGFARVGFVLSLDRKPKPLNRVAVEAHDRLPGQCPRLPDLGGVLGVVRLDRKDTYHRCDQGDDDGDAAEDHEPPPLAPRRGLLRAPLLVHLPPGEDRLGEDVVEELVALASPVVSRGDGAEDAAALAEACRARP